MFGFSGYGIDHIWHLRVFKESFSWVYPFDSGSKVSTERTAHASSHGFIVVGLSSSRKDVVLLFGSQQMYIHHTKY